MNQHKRKSLILFSNTFPYGGGETFLADELPFVAAQFSQVNIYPLFKASSGKTLHNNLQLPDNVEIKEPLIGFEDKNRLRLLKSGMLTILNPLKSFATIFGVKEFIFRTLFGGKIKLLENQHKASLFKRVKIFFTYLCVYRSIRGNSKLWKKLLSDCAISDVLYFYWGDKTILIAPDLKKQLAGLCNVVPKICARFHGSDFYEGAKGYLPWREEIYKAVDFAATTSNHATSYIKANYKNQPTELKSCYLGSMGFTNETSHKKEEKDVAVSNENTLRILSCSNIIELKRVDLIFRSVTAILDEEKLFSQLQKSGYSKIEWVHFGGGTESSKLEQIIGEYSASRGENQTLKIKMMGYTPHQDILDYYKSVGGDLFVLLSRSEGVPISLMEALSCSIPIISTNVGGVKEIFDCSERYSDRQYSIGYLLDSFVSPQIVAETILSFASLSQSEKNQMRQNSYECWKKHWNGADNYLSFAQILSDIAQ